MESATDASQLLRKGQTYQFAKPPDFAAAEKAYRGAIDVAPDWGEPYHWLGFVLERQGHLQSAEDAYLRAIQLLSGDPRPLIALGGLQRRRGQYGKAIESLQAGLILKPRYAEADARLMLAESFEGAGDIEQALAQWQVVAQMEPYYPSHGKPMKEAKKQLAKRGVRGDG